MGKGAKSKKTRRNNALKRKIMQPLTQSSLKKLNHINEMQKKGFDMLQPPPKNAFRYPNDPDAVFPQKKVAPIVDLRASSNIDVLLQMQMKRTKKPKDIVFIKTTEQLLEEEQEKINKQALEEDSDDEAEAHLINAMGRMVLKDHLKKKGGRARRRQARRNGGGGMATEGGNRVSKQIKKKGKGRRRARKNKTFH